MDFYSDVVSGVISGVSAAAVLGLFALAWKSSRPRPDFVLQRHSGTWVLTRTRHKVAINVQWSVADTVGMLVHSGEPQAVPPDIQYREIELIASPLMPNDQLTVFWGAADRTNSQAVTIVAGVDQYQVWAINRHPARLRL